MENENCKKVDERRDVEKTEREMIVDINDEELLERGRELAQLQQDMSDLEDDFEVQKQNHKAEIKKIEIRQDQLCQAIRSKRDQLRVECEKVMDYKNNSIFYVYRGKSYDRRAMEPRERQMVLSKEPKTH